MTGNPDVAANECEPVRGQTALHAAVATEHVPCELLVRLVPASDAEVPGVLRADNEGCTALHGAAARGQLDAVQVLLSLADAESEARRLSHKRVTPLAAACRRGHADVARLLVQVSGLDPRAVYLCLVKDRGLLLDELLRMDQLRHGATDGEVDSKGGSAGGVNCCFATDGVSALMMAAEAGELEVTRALLALGADAGAYDSDGQTALMRAAFFGHTKLVAALVHASAQVNAVDGAGNSALHHAGRGAQEATFLLLELRHGADTALANALGEVPSLSEEPCRMQ